MYNNMWKIHYIDKENVMANLKEFGQGVVNVTNKAIKNSINDSTNKMRN